MATYASATNPFIKSNLPDVATSERLCKKDAPGMAKPQSFHHETYNQLVEVDLLLENNDDNLTPVVEEKNINEIPPQPVNGLIESEKFSLDEVTSSISQPTVVELTFNSDSSNNILELGSELVETAIRLELERSDYQNLNKLETDETTTTEKQSDNGSTEDAEDDEHDDENEQAPMEQNSRQHQHIELIKKLRLQLRDLERYAYERGELEQVPLSVLAERQSVILDTLKDRLSLKICTDELEKFKLDELKKQVDKELHELIDPMITKEHLLNQLKTQLTDLERYISHLHGTLGKMHGERSCSCHLHGCSSEESGQTRNSSTTESSGIINDDSLPKTSRLIRNLVTQLICSDLKVQETAKKENELEKKRKQVDRASTRDQPQSQQDEPAWSLQIDSVILATDSLVNLFTLESKSQLQSGKCPDESLVESVVRRQLVPAIRDLLSYGLFDPATLTRSASYASILFDPYYLFTSLTCFPSFQKTSHPPDRGSIENKIHIWNVIEDYYHSRSEPGFKTSSVKTLSQSFNLAPSINGPIKITSKQALLIAIDDTIETMSKCKPNGPESHFRAFIYTALNRSKLTTWLRIIFKNKSVARKYYHNFSPVNQPDKMDKFLNTIEPLNQFQFKLRTDAESIEQFISAF